MSPILTYFDPMVWVFLRNPPTWGTILYADPQVGEHFPFALAKPHSPAWFEGELVVPKSSASTALASEVTIHSGGESPTCGCGW